MDIKKRLRESLIKELDLGTYKKIAGDTSNYPMTQQNDTKDNRNNPRSKSNKMGRVNIASNERFENAANKQFSGTEINTNDGVFKFETIKLLNNAGWYGLWLSQPSEYSKENGEKSPIDKHILITLENGKPYIKNYFDNKKIELDSNSISVVMGMLKYNK